VGDQGTTAIRIGLHEVAGLRWPQQVLAGDGKRETTAVPLPRLPLGVVGVLLILSGFVPNEVSRVTGAPYVARDQLRFPKARPEAVAQLVKLNPKVTIDRVPPAR
jgi:hypothetical protein